MRPAVGPILEVLARIELRAPTFPIAENVTRRARDRRGRAPRSSSRARRVAGPVGDRASGRSPLPAPPRSSRPVPATCSRSSRSGSCPTRAAVAVGSPEAAAPRSPAHDRAPSPQVRRLHRPAWSDILGAVTRYATIAGVGSALPPRLVPNTWFEAIVDDERRVDPRPHGHRGPPLRRRRRADLRPRASRPRAARSTTAGIPAEQLDMIVCATITGDTPFPATAVWVQTQARA